VGFNDEEYAFSYLNMYLYLDVKQKVENALFCTLLSLKKLQIPKDVCVLIAKAVKRTQSEVCWMTDW
jgi:hypothetical protein